MRPCLLRTVRGFTVFLTLNLFVFFNFTSAAWAAPPLSVLQTAVFIVCDSRQGTGVLTNADEGYVITVGHVVMDPETRAAASECQAGFLSDETLVPKSFYSASVVHVILDTIKDLDFAVLRIGRRLAGPPFQLSNILKTNEFSSAGDALTVFGFPNSSSQALQISGGSIIEFSRGSIRSNTEISPGFSGAPAVDRRGDLIGMAARIRTLLDAKTGEEKSTDYEFSDVLSLIAWLDSFEPHGHGRYLSHADPAVFHGAPYVIRNEELGCSNVVRTFLSPAVYCLLPERKRLVFPNEKTFRSWFADFSSVLFVSSETIAKYMLVGNVTYKAGTLVKIQTDPKVYLVTDSIGTLRWVPSETRAVQLFGPNWVGLVKDVPDAFFVNYTVGPPLQDLP